MLLCRFAPSGFVLCTRILSRFTLLGFAFAFSVSLLPQTLRFELTFSVALRFVFTKIFEKKECNLIDSKCSETHRKARLLICFAPSGFALAFSVTLLPKSLCFALEFLVTLLPWALCFALAFSVAFVSSIFIGLCACTRISQSILDHFTPLNFAPHAHKNFLKKRVCLNRLKIDQEFQV